MKGQNQWDLEFWENELGHCPAEDALNKIKASNFKVYQFIRKTIEKFSRWPITYFLRSKYIKRVRGELLEYRITALGNEFRMLGIIQYPLDGIPSFLCLHCLLKKRDRLSSKDIDLAFERLKIYKGQS